MPETSASVIPPNISLRGFIAAGSLGPVRLGVHKDDVRFRLGGPDQWRDKPAIWKYGGVEVSFAGKNVVAPRDTVTMIFTDDFDRVVDWIDYWVLTPDLTMNKAKDHLTSEGISFQETDIPTLSGNRCLVTASDVRLQFSNRASPFEDEEQGEPQLVAVCLSLSDVRRRLETE